MKIRHLLLLCLIAISFALKANEKTIIPITTDDISLIYKVNDGNGRLYQSYLGQKLSFDSDIAQLPLLNEAYLTHGMEDYFEPAIRVLHNDGNPSLLLKYVSHSTQQLRPGENETVIVLRDAVYPVEVKLHYIVYPKENIIKEYTEISHQEKKPVILNQFASAYLPIRRGDVWLSHLYGSWANEGQLSQEPLTPGMKVIKNKDGVRNSHTSHAEVMFSLDGKPQENTGHVIGAALCYSGNYKLRIDTHDDEYHHFFAGINEDNSTYSLKKDELFRTPALALTYSNEGLSGSSRNFHRWARLYKLAHGTTPRKILLNSWEGVWLDVKEPEMHQMMDDIAYMGGELFVMDDGWFGKKYRRTTDSSSLGDWVVDTQKLPNGIKGLTDAAKKKGIKFGIWIEPEFTNTKSELIEKHPDWVLRIPNRNLRQGRGGTQVALDLCNPKVQDFVFNLVDTLLTNYPDIAYIKWDANNELNNYGSTYLPVDKQTHIYIEYHRGLTKVLERIRAKYPKVVIQACGSGGGRVNYGVMPYYDEFWVSDNTDALQRIFIQWGTSYFYPSNAMAQHVNTSPSHQLGRIVPIKFRFAVAMSGRLGMEIQPKDMTNDEKEFAKKAIADYKHIRPLVQTGNLYRMVSPYERKGIASLMYSNDDKSRAVFFAYKMENFVNELLPRARMAGLDRNKNYKIRELNLAPGAQPCHLNDRVFAGSLLMDTGVELHFPKEFDSWVLELTEVK